MKIAITTTTTRNKLKIKMKNGKFLKLKAFTCHLLCIGMLNSIELQVKPLRVHSSIFLILLNPFEPFAVICAHIHVHSSAINVYSIMCRQQSLESIYSIWISYTWWWTWKEKKTSIAAVQYFNQLVKLSYVMCVCVSIYLVLVFQWDGVSDVNKQCYFSCGQWPWNIGDCSLTSASKHSIFT